MTSASPNPLSSPSPVDLQRLEARWAALAGDAGLAPFSPEVKSLGSELIARYGAPHRYYHGVEHLTAVLSALDDLSHPQPAPVNTRFAAWFHDAIYEGIAGTDEEHSAQLAAEQLVEVGYPTDQALTVAAMVKATALHLIPEGQDNPSIDRATALLLDADLSILGAAPEHYRAYTDGVRAEYSAIPETQFVAGRINVVETLLSRPNLFRTELAQRIYDEAARRNLRQELHRLQQSQLATDDG